MFDVHIVWKRWLFVIRKNLWDNLNLFKFVCVEESLYLWVLWLDYLLWISWICFESYGKLGLKA